MPHSGHLFLSNYLSPPHSACTVPVLLLHRVPHLGLVLVRGPYVKAPPTQSLTLVLLHSPTVPFPRWRWCWKHSSTAELSQQSPRVALTPHSHVWVHTGTPRDTQQLPDSALRAEALLAPPLLPWLGQRPVGVQTSAFPWCCLESLCMHSPAKSYSPWSSRREHGITQPRILAVWGCEPFCEQLSGPPGLQQCWPGCACVLGCSKNKNFGKYGRLQLRSCRGTQVLQQRRLSSGEHIPGLPWCQAPGAP